MLFRSGIGMNCAGDILPVPVVNPAKRELFANRVIAPELVGGYQANSFGDSLPNEAEKRGAVGALDHASNHLSLTLHRADNNGLAESASTASTTSSAGAAALVAMPILGLPTDEGFINLNEPDQLAEVNVSHCSAHLVAQDRKSTRLNSSHG